MHVLRLVAVSLAVAVIGASTAAAAAQAGVSPPATVSVADLDVEHFAIAINPCGERSAVAFEGLVRNSRGRRTQLFARLGGGRSSFGPRQELDDVRSGPGIRAQGAISDVRVAVAPDGGAVAAWIVTTVARRNGPVRYSVRYASAPAKGRFGRAQTALRPPRDSNPGLAGLVAGRNGLAVVLLERGNRVEALVRRRAGRRFARPQRIGGDTAFEAPPSLALAPSGVVVAGWTQRDATARAALLRRGGRRFGAARSVSPAGEPSGLGRAVSGPGGAGVAWKVSASPDKLTRFARLRSATGAFAPAVTVADDNLSGGPQLALPRLGIATAWRQYEVAGEPGDNDVFRNPRLFATASWLTGAGRQALSQPPALTLRPALAALPDRALVAWEEVPAHQDASRVRLAVAGPGGWEPTATIAAAGPVTPRTRPATSVLGDERPSGSDLAIAAGRSGALLAFSTSKQTGGADGLVSTLHVARYRP